MRNKIIFLSLFVSNINYILFNSIGINDTLKNGIRVGVIGLLLFSILFNRKAITFRKEDLLWVFLLFCSLFSFNISQIIINFVYIILVLIVSKEIEKNRLVKWNYYIMIISIFFVVFILITGITNNLQYSIGGRVRHTFGFSNVNAFSSLVYSFFIMYFMYKDKISKTSTIILVLTMYFIFRFTDTRTMLLAFFIYLFIYILLSRLFKYKKISRRTLKIVLVSLVFAPIIFSFISPFLLENYPYLDVVLSKRLSIFSSYINRQQPINYLFGGTTVKDIDNGFLTIFFNTGVLFTSYIIYLIVKSINYSVDNKNFKNIAFIISFVYFNAFESLILRPEIVVSICFWIVVYNSLKHKSVNLEEKVEYNGI
jgi:hypothetical protein